MASTEPAILWQPSPERIERATITTFAAWVQEHRDVDVTVTGSYDALWRWSVDDLEGFWSAIWDYFDVHSHGRHHEVLDAHRMPGAQWFAGARLNYAEHVFRGKDDDALALQAASERHAGLTAWTWGRLRQETARIAAGLTLLGVGEGDRVAAYLPNIPEAIAAFLACASLGAIWSSTSPDFGTRSVVDRFAQIEPKVLLAVDGYRYGGKDFDRRGVVSEIAAAIEGLQHTVVLGQLDGTGWPEGFLGDGAAPLGFQPVAFDHPLWVLYSSGTTGLPKAIVHGHGGILVEQLKSHHLQVDAQVGDRLFWFTTTGWMMWNFLVGGLLTQASIVLYDGNPGTPSLDRLWDLAAEAGVTIFGTSASYLAACAKAGIEPGSGRDLSALAAVGSTGSPLSPEGFAWVYEHVGADTWLFSTSGGTDVCTSFVGGVPTLPVVQGELQCRTLGVAVESWDEAGRPHVGLVGELVVTEPMPSMPLFLWNDPDGTRLHEAYFDTYPGVWRHGDWIEITDRGSAIITGRSDSTINRGGIRMGTSEIYRAVLADDGVLDALVVDVPGRDGFEQGWMPMFVVLREGVALDEERVNGLRSRIRADCSPRHVPDEIHQVDVIPRTLSGKVLEVPVKRILMGAEPGDVASRDSLADPAAFDRFVALARAL